jgi:HSP20 family protein
MSLIAHRRGATTAAPEQRPTDFFENFFADWPSMFRRPFVVVPEGVDAVRSDEFREDGTLVVRIEMAGIDPQKDVEVSLEGDVLRIDAERREEEETNERDYARHELRYASFHREMLVPAGTKESDVKASYKDGILEVRVPAETESEPPPAAKIPIDRT